MTCHPYLRVGRHSFPIQTACNMVTFATPIVTTPPAEETSSLQTIPMVLQLPAIPRSNTRPSPSNRWLTRRNDDAPCRMTSSVKLRSDGVSSSMSGRALRPKWLTCINANKHLRQTAAWQSIIRSHKSPPSLRTARTWPLQLHFCIHCPHSPQLG
jgi:hypothetical protein